MNTDWQLIWELLLALAAAVLPATWWGWTAFVLAALWVSRCYNMGVFLVGLALASFLPGGVGRYFFNVAIAHDQLLNTKTGGSYKGTVSGRTGKSYARAVKRGKGVMWPWIWLVRNATHKFDPYHVEFHALNEWFIGRRAVFGYKKPTEVERQFLLDEVSKASKKRAARFRESTIAA